MSEQKKKVIFFGIFFLALTALTVGFIYYIDVAACRVPIMDYWEWIADYGPKFVDHSIGVKDFIINPDKSAMSAQHMSPGSSALQLWILYFNKFDVWVLVILGTIIRVLAGWCLTLVFIRKCYRTCKSKAALLITGLLIFAAYINLNQWEVLSQPFIFTFSFRVALYLLSFFWAQEYYNNLENGTVAQNIIQTILFGVYCGLLTILISSAYFVGHLFAIILTGIIKFIWCPEFRKKAKFSMPIYVVLQMIAVLLYYTMIRLSVSLKGGSTAGINFKIIDVIKGLFVYIGSLIVPQTYVESAGYESALAIGTFIFVIMIALMIAYFKLGIDKKSLFPFMCIVYAGTTGAVIAVGRVSAFGIGTMNSSRYVVESTIGLIGLIWMGFEVLQNVAIKSVIGLDKIVLVTALTIGLSFSATTEIKIAPYRGAYYTQLYNYMLDVDNVDDSSLGVFQNTPENVRFVVEFFKENNYSIFQPDFKYR